MARSVVRPRRLGIAALAVCMIATALVVLLPQPARSAPPQAVLVVRSSGDRDVLWRIDPATSTAESLGDLPGRARVAAVSPDGANVAYLPEKVRPVVWIGYGPLGPRSISLAKRGLKAVDSLTWVDDHRLIVAGTTSRATWFYKNRLILVDASTGKSVWFNKLMGTEPYAAPALGKFVYTRLQLLKAGTAANNYQRRIRESMRVASVATGRASTVSSSTYTTDVDHRDCARPQLSQDGEWFITGTTGSDVSVIYSIQGKWGTQLLSVATAASDVKAGWTSTGLTAFAGSPSASPDNDCRIWVCDPVRATLACTTPGLLPDLWITDLAWSSAGELVAGAVSTGTQTRTTHVYVISRSLATATDLGAGRLPVWVTP